MPRYNTDYLHPKKLTKYHISIIMGIELFYGNYKQYLLSIVIQEDEYFRELFEYYRKMNEFLEESQKAIIEGGIQEAEKLKEKYREAAKKYSELRQKLPSKVTDVAKKLDIDETELLTITRRVLGDSAE